MLPVTPSRMCFPFNTTSPHPLTELPRTIPEDSVLARNRLREGSSDSRRFRRFLSSPPRCLSIEFRNALRVVSTRRAGDSLRRQTPHVSSNASSSCSLYTLDAYTSIALSMTFFFDVRSRRASQPMRFTTDASIRADSILSIGHLSILRMRTSVRFLACQPRRPTTPSEVVRRKGWPDTIAHSPLMQLNHVWAWRFGPLEVGRRAKKPRRDVPTLPALGDDRDRLPVVTG